MFRHFLSVLFVTGLIISLGCSSNPTVPQGSDDIAACLGAPPSLGGIVGSYTWTGNDGNYQTGNVISDEQGNLTFVADRGTAVESVPILGIALEYENHRGLYQGLYPIYRRGDTIVYNMDIDYNGGVPLNLHPILNAQLIACTRFWPSMIPLPGESTQIWDPLEIEPYGSVELRGRYTIPMDCYFSWGCTTIDFNICFRSGLLEFNMSQDVCGIFDP